MELCIYCDSQISVMILCVLSYSGSLCPRQKKKKKIIYSFIHLFHSDLWLWARPHAECQTRSRAKHILEFLWPQ